MTNSTPHDIIKIQKETKTFETNLKELDKRKDFIRSLNDKLKSTIAHTMYKRNAGESAKFKRIEY